MIRIGTHATMECTLVCPYHISYKAPANQKKSFPHKKGQRHKDGLQMICPATLFFSIFFVGLFCCCNTAKPRDGEKREAYIHLVSGEVYDTLLLLVQGKFEVPVSKRTWIQRNTVVRFWRRREDFHLGPERTPTLYFAGKKVANALLGTSSALITNNLMRRGNNLQDHDISLKWTKIDLFRLYILFSQYVIILSRIGSLFCSLKRTHASMNMSTCTLLNEQNKGPILLSIST